LLYILPQLQNSRGITTVTIVKAVTIFTEIIMGAVLIAVTIVTRVSAEAMAAIATIVN